MLYHVAERFGSRIDLHIAPQQLGIMQRECIIQTYVALDHCVSMEKLDNGHLSRDTLFDIDESFSLLPEQSAQVAYDSLEIYLGRILVERHANIQITFFHGKAVIWRAEKRQLCVRVLLRHNWSNLLEQFIPDCLLLPGLAILVHDVEADAVQQNTPLVGELGQRVQYKGLILRALGEQMAVLVAARADLRRTRRKADYFRRESVGMRVNVSADDRGCREFCFGRCQVKRV